MGSLKRIVPKHACKDCPQETSACIKQHQAHETVTHLSPEVTHLEALPSECPLCGTVSFPTASGPMLLMLSCVVCQSLLTFEGTCPNSPLSPTLVNSTGQSEVKVQTEATR